MAEENKQNKNEMRKTRIEKVVLSIGGREEDLDKGVKLLQKLTNKKPVKRKSEKRIPGLGVSPGMEVGCIVTLRGREAKAILKKMLAAIDNKIREKQISTDTFSFGIPEYIEIPGIEYQRDIGIIGLAVCVSFYRKGKRISKRRKKKRKLPKKQHVTKQDIINYLEKNFNTEVIMRRKRK